MYTQTQTYIHVCIYKHMLLRRPPPPPPPVRRSATKPRLPEPSWPCLKTHVVHMSDTQMVFFLAFC